MLDLDPISGAWKAGVRSAWETWTHSMPRQVHPNYLATETDQRTIVAGLKLCRRILVTPQMQSLIETASQPT